MMLEIIFAGIAGLILMWLTLSIFTFIITMVRSPLDLHDVTINETKTKGSDAAKSKKL